MVSAQQSNVKLISGNFQQATIAQFISELESKSNFHFYYDPILFDSLRVTLQVNDKPVEAVLDMAFKNTDFHYAITPQQQVFLTKGRQIRTELAPGFMQAAPGNAPVKQTTTVVDYTDERDKKVPEATTENKLYEIGTKTNAIKSGNATLSGYIRDIKSGEAVTGASIYIANTKSGVATDRFGYFTITLPRGRHVLNVRGIGMRDTRRQIILYSDGKLNIEMQEQVNTLKEVKISADKVANVRSVELGVTRLDIKNIKQFLQLLARPMF
ncbi:MAG: hypothetical protein NVSMB24_10890 [Mucilaginibacter sp.]